MELYVCLSVVRCDHILETVLTVFEYVSICAWQLKQKNIAVTVSDIT